MVCELYLNKAVTKTALYLRQQSHTFNVSIQPLQHGFSSYKIPVQNKETFFKRTLVWMEKHPMYFKNMDSFKLWYVTSLLAL